MRHSPLLRTRPANIAFMLIAIVVFIWSAVVIASKTSILNTVELAGLAISVLSDPRSEPAAFLTLLSGIVFSLLCGPAITRALLSRRLYAVVTVAAIAVIDPLLSVVTVASVISAFAFIRLCYGEVGASFTSLFDFRAISWRQRMLYTFAGAGLVLGILTMPRLPFDVFSLLPWGSSNVYGMAAVLLGLIVSGYIIGNLYFPLISGSKWAIGAFLAAMAVVNPVIAGIMACGVVALVWLRWSDVAPPASRKKRRTFSPCPHDAHYLNAMHPSQGVPIQEMLGRK